MLSVTLIGIEKEYEDSPKNNEDEWIIWRCLKLFDQHKQQSIPEWFYVGACSPNYVDHTDIREAEKRALLVQNTFNEEELYAFARRKFDPLDFTDWDDFYAKMSGEFVYDE